MTHDFGVILKLLGNLHDDSPAFQINGIPWLNNNKKNLDPQKTIPLKILKLQGYSLQLTGFSQVLVHFCCFLDHSLIPQDTRFTPCPASVQRLPRRCRSLWQAPEAASFRLTFLECHVGWVVPLPSNSHHKDYYSFSRGIDDLSQLSQL